MATWETKCCTGNAWVDGTYIFNVAAQTVTLASTGAAFMGGGGSGNFNSALAVGKWNSSFHIVDNIDGSYNDKCANGRTSGHTNYLRMASATPTSFYKNSANTLIAFSATVPDSAYGIYWHFWHGVTAVINPIQFWIGSGTDANSPQYNAYFRAKELNVAGSWSAASPDFKLSLTNHTTNTGHSWVVAVASKPTEIGVNNQNIMKISATYS